MLQSCGRKSFSNTKNPSASKEFGPGPSQGFSLDPPGTLSSSHADPSMRGSKWEGGGGGGSGPSLPPLDPRMEGSAWELLKVPGGSRAKS